MTDARRFETILVATDFSPTADRALEAARELVLAAGSGEIVLAHAKFVPREVEALAVYGAEKVFAQIEKAAVEQLDKRLAELVQAGVPARQVHVDGRPSEVILDLARREGADLIVMGTHGRTGLSHVLLGSVAERVVRQAECPVMTVPPGKGASGEASR